MDFNYFIRNADENNLCSSFDRSKKPLYICRPHCGVEQYPSIWLRTGYLLNLRQKMKIVLLVVLNDTSRGRAVGSSSGS